MIDTIKTELESGGYSTDHFTALNQLRFKEEVVQGFAATGDVLIYLASIGVLRKIQERAKSTIENDPIADACEAALITMNSKREFDFTSPSVLGMLQGFVVDGLITDADKEAILDIGKTTTYPFENTQLHQVLKARGVTNEQVINWNGKQHLKITVVGDVVEPFNPYVTVTNDIYTNENIGRTKRISEAGAHIIDLNGLGKHNRGNPKLTIELNALNDFTVELV